AGAGKGDQAGSRDFNLHAARRFRFARSPEAPFHWLEISKFYRGLRRKPPYILRNASIVAVRHAAAISILTGV
ncbi:MAG: hypothetical protein WA656_03915, partial [Pseudolabrys sp.]